MRAVVVTMKDTGAHILMNDLADDKQREAITNHKLK